MLAPQALLGFFNSLSTPLALPHAPLVGSGMWLGLAGAYMYLVTLLAWAMTRWPDDRRLPWLLVHAKLASAILSLLLFFHARHLILALNFVVDFSIGLFVLWLRNAECRPSWRYLGLDLIFVHHAARFALARELPGGRFKPPSWPLRHATYSYGDGPCRAGR